MEDKLKLPDDVIKFFADHGRAGGKKRAKNLTKKERAEIARKASQARWKKAAQTRNSNGRQDS
jgi:hypothetical protein